MSTHTLLVLSPAALEPQFDAGERDLWGQLGSPIPIVSVVREAMLSLVASAASMDGTEVVLLSDATTPEILSMAVGSVDVAPVLHGEVTASSGAAPGLVGRAYALRHCVSEEGLMGELEARRLVLVDPELDSESTRREVADLLSDAVTNLTLVSSSPTYGVLDGDLITISRALGLTIPADGFGYRCRHGEHLPSVKSSPL